MSTMIPIPDDKRTRDRGNRILQQLSEEQFELLMKVDRIETKDGAVDADDLEMYEMAVIADIYDMFEKNEYDDLIDPFTGRPMDDLRKSVDLDNPPDTAGRNRSRLDVLVNR